MAAQKVCIVGAGSSGITACQVLSARGIPFDCFEKGSKIGGNWRYENDNGTSSAYRSLHINSSRKLMPFKAFPPLSVTRSRSISIPTCARSAASRSG